MLQSDNVALIFLLFLGIAVSFAFAENPTPYNEWDFDISELTLKQNQSDLEKLDISITVMYKGELPTGIANVYADITNPDGYSHKIFDQTQILSVGESQTIVLSAHMATDGKYEVDVALSPPENPYLDHIFDAENATFTVNPNGRERIIDSVGDSGESVISYSLHDYREVRYNEMVHAVITLPQDHMFEKIAVVNGKFVREYSTDTKDIYINSDAPFKNLKVKLVEQGNLLPLADAQDTMLEYVKFYSNNKELCTKVFCINIDPVDEPEYPLEWLLLIPVAGAAAYFLMKTRPKPYPSDPTKHVNDKGSKKQYETKDYIDNVGNPLKLFCFS